MTGNRHHGITLMKLLLICKKGVFKFHLLLGNYKTNLLSNITDYIAMNVPKNKKKNE